MVEYKSVNVTLTVPLITRINRIVEKRTTNFSQVVREATSMGLEKME